MTSAQWQDLAIKIGLKQGKQYPVDVLESPAGETTSSTPLELPWSEDELEQVLLQLRQFSTNALFLREFGDRLFASLFQGYVRARYDESLGRVAEQGGLRLRLRIEDPQLAVLPWELLYDRERREFLGLSKQVQVIRYLPIGRPVAKLEVKPPLRLLVVMSSPKDTRPISIEREKTLILQALSSLVAKGMVQVEFLEHTNKKALREKVKADFHVLHFMGHGRFEGEVGYLLLEDSDGWTDPLDGRMLAVFLKGTSIRLVVLNACEGARGAPENVDEPTYAGFVGVAHALVEAGLPAVVAMQFKITEPSALCFAREFYKALAEFQEVDQCVANTREALLSECGWDYADWATPVLFLRARSGAVFQSQPTKPLDEGRIIIKTGETLMIHHPVCGTWSIPVLPTTGSPFIIEITSTTVLIRHSEFSEHEGAGDD